MKILVKVLKVVGLVLGGLALALALLIGYIYLRPNRARVDTSTVVESWDVANDEMHNSNTDLIEWQGQFYAAYVSSPYHFGNDASVLHVKRSADLGRTWQQVETFNPPGEDIRDPKFAIIGQRLFLYALKNTSFIAEPYLSIYAYTENGTDWTDFKAIAGVDGWLFWRPKTRDGVTFYNSAYWWEHGKAILLKSTDGIAWETVSTISSGARNDETEIEFLPDGRLWATSRMEYGEGSEAIFGDPRGSTLISEAQPPYTKWTVLAESRVTRLDGPYLFSYHDRVYAVGRYQPNPGRTGPFTDQGSCLAPKRTSLYEIRANGLAYLTDLPSDGDTAYVGLVVKGDTAYASYYTSPINRDFVWLMGMLLPSSVRMAKIDLRAMEGLANQAGAR
jgi:hypothetical protein